MEVKVDRESFYRELEVICVLPPGAFVGGELLSFLEGWDSLTVLSFMAMALELLEVSVAVPALVECKSVEDLCRLMGDKISN